MGESNWIALRADEDAVVSAVRARFEEGPFRPAQDGETAHRVVEVGRMAKGDELLVHERGVAAHRHDSLRRWLTEKLSVSTRLQIDVDGVERGSSSQLDPTMKDSVEAAAFDVASSESLARFSFVIDPEEQQVPFHGLQPKIEREVPSLFPIQSRSRLAHLGCDGVKIYGPNEKYAPGIFRYQMAVCLELKLSLFAPARNDDETRGPLLDVRREKLTFSQFDVLAPGGTFIWRGEERWIPSDENVAEYLRNLRVGARHIRDVMSERTDWGKHVTPKTIVDPES